MDGGSSRSDRTKLIIGNIKYSMNEDELREVVAPISEIVSLRIPRAPNNRSKGFGIIEFKTTEDAERVKEELDGKEVQGRKMYIRFDDEETASHRPKRFEDRGGRPPRDDRNEYRREDYSRDGRFQRESRFKRDDRFRGRDDQEDYRHDDRGRESFHRGGMREDDRGRNDRGYERRRYNDDDDRRDKRGKRYDNDSNSRRRKQDSSSDGNEK
jgi:RNA recognition motif-containing protein